MSVILISIATLGSLLSLWGDEFLRDKITIDESDSEESKTEKLEAQVKREKSVRIKSTSSLFILLTFIFTIIQIQKSHKSANEAMQDKIAQRISDSTRYANDSLLHIEERERDREARTLIDSIYNVQLNALRAQVLAGKTVDSIKKKTTALLQNLRVVDTTIRNNNLVLKENAEYVLQSFYEIGTISQRAQRQLYILDDDIKMRFDFGFSCSESEREIQKFIKENGLSHKNYVEIDQSFSHYKDWVKVLQNSTLKFYFYHPTRKSALEYRFIPNEFMMLLRNKNPMPIE